MASPLAAPIGLPPGAAERSGAALVPAWPLLGLRLPDQGFLRVVMTLTALLCAVAAHRLSRDCKAARPTTKMLPLDEPLLAPAKGNGTVMKITAENADGHLVRFGDHHMFGLARCLASAHVVAGHMQAMHASVVDVPLFYWGFTWVPWFFMLSGFVLYTAQAERPRQESAWQTVVRHTSRVYPTYALCFVISYMSHTVKARDTWCLVTQVWLLQAFALDLSLNPLKWVTEHVLLGQCWFLSCLVMYWFCFNWLYEIVSRRWTTVTQVSSAIFALCSLPWLSVLIPFLLGDVNWCNRHIWGRSSTTLDFWVVFLKFNPVTYVHVFLVGMLLARLRELLSKEVWPQWVAPWRNHLVHALAPLGYLGLLFFFLDIVPLTDSALAARLSVLMPFQSAVLLGLAGVPGCERPIAASISKAVNWVEPYSFGMYMMQFLCWSCWPGRRVGPLFCLFLPSVAVVVVCSVQLPADRLWQWLQKLPYLNKTQTRRDYKHHIFWVAPGTLSLLILASGAWKACSEDGYLDVFLSSEGIFAST